MEDDSKALDDFFSKKDRSKKSKTKSKKSSKTNESETKQKSGGTVQKQQHETEDEWKDFEAPPEKDYTGLKIQALQIVSDEQKEKEEAAEKEDGEDHDDPLSRDVSSGPWQKGTPAPQPAQQVVEEQPAPKPTGKYVPPGSLANRQRMARQRPGHPPDLASESVFPTLGMSAAVNKRSEKETRDFEVVKKGTRTQDSRMDSSSARLDLGNRYDSLRH